MRLVFSLNVAGDVRLQCLRDKVVSKVPGVPKGTPLVCSRKVQEHSDTASGAYPVGFGALSKGTTFGRAAKRFIREAGALVDRADKSHVVFLTGTLPGTTDASMMALAQWSGWVVQTVLNWVRDYAIDGRAFGVWEWQKRGALHLHVCVECKTVQQAINLKKRWKARWIKIMDSVSLRSGQDLYGRKIGGTWKNHKWVTRTDAQTVVKSVGCYLSKYLSKGSQSLRRISRYAPSRWWFASKCLRKEVVSCRRETAVPYLSLNDATTLFERCGSYFADNIDRVFYYVCKFNVQEKGYIGLAKPIQAHMIYEHVAAILRCLQTTDRQWSECKMPTAKLIATMFGGSVAA